MWITAIAKELLDLMEHLALPEGGLRTEREFVPFVCRKEYDGGDFLSYPIREGVSHALPVYGKIPGVSPYWLHEQHHKTPVDELEDFFQRWLFFGLISEVLGDRYPRRELTVTASAGEAPSMVLSTSRLVLLLDDWVADVHTGNVQPQQEYEHVAECLRLTFATLLAAGPDFNPQIKLSLASVGEIFAFAANKAFKMTKSLQDNKCPGTWSSLITEDYWRPIMLDGGWCPRYATIRVSIPI